MDKTANTIFIDVREPNEYVSGHLEGAINIPLGTIVDNSSQLQDIDKDSHIVVYCRSGARAENAKLQLQQLGFEDVSNGINQAEIEKSNS
ncbi:MAG TPA: rhodanese-like domain-containing protein [Candidatus Saccharibacteria bacterium]|nr:rhodanese-like domain-containing protein [Candidatus Saccharibacteria bacterium]HMT39898.1 rhodanese-like domain-containing protein [Candidatus Saccharibacteria bacterium]